LLWKTPPRFESMSVVVCVASSVSRARVCRVRVVLLDRRADFVFWFSFLVFV
jgi:hypothetical protein